MIVSLIFGLIFGLIIVMISKSIYLPDPMWIMAVTFFKKPYAFIENVEYQRFPLPSEIKKSDEEWDLIDDTLTLKGMRNNIHFFLWPFFQIHKFDISYTRLISPEQKKEGDIVIKEILDKDGRATKMLIERKRLSNHLIFREAYPMYTEMLSTIELANIRLLVSPIYEIRNPSKVLFAGIPNWLQSANKIVESALREYVAKHHLVEFNKIASEGGSEGFNTFIKDAVNIINDMHPGLGNLGLKLFKISFIDYEPADDEAKRLMSAVTNVVIAEEEGKALFQKAKGEADAEAERATGKKKATITIAEGEAEAYKLQQEKIVEWKKKYLVETGLAKVDASGNITELVPDANTKITSEALKELSKVTGTLVISDGALSQFLNITKKEN